MKVDIDRKGWERLFRRIEALPVLTAEHILGAAFKAASGVLVSAMRSTTGFRDRRGWLRRTIRAQPVPLEVDTRTGKKRVADAGGLVIAGAAPGEPKAVWIEYGHGGPKPAPAHPFFQPTVEATRRAVFNATVREARARYNKLAGPIRRTR